jgi:ABC-type glycerol-3-phosphate transport system substrate-binding protein
MMGIQDSWFREQIVKPFETLHDTDITVTSFDRFWDLEVMLALDKKRKKHTIGLVKTPLEMTRTLKDYMLPLDTIFNEEELKVLKAEYDPVILEKGVIDGTLYYIPRKLETRMMIYVKSKVEEAVKGWTRYKDDIRAALEKDNGYGLPKGYILEDDPNEWDYYDMFVAAFYWSRTPYHGIIMPRMAHRGRKYGGTVVGLLDRIYQMGGTQENIIKISSAPVVEMFLWEAAFKKNGLYHPGMWQDPWSGGGIWNGMKDGKVFLAMMHQIDSFFIHGGTHTQMQGYLTDPEDMGVAVMPCGLSFDLDSDGIPRWTGSKRASTAGWWWGIPKTAQNPQLSATLARWITNYENHKKECRTFGMMPVRKDILSNLHDVFPDDWMADVFKVSIRQIALNRGATVPLLADYPEIGKIYLEAWYDIVVGENYGPEGKINRDFIRTRLEKIYVPKMKMISGERYPME